MWVDIVTMNTALANVFLETLSLQVWYAPPSYSGAFANRSLFLLTCPCGLLTITEVDLEANCQRMADNWQPASGFHTLVLRLFTSAAFTGCTNFTMANSNIFNIGLCIIKQWGMHAEEYKAWIARKVIRPRIIKTFNSFKIFWAAKITLVNQTAILTSQYGYRMAATNNDNSVDSYEETILNFGAVYAATQESVKLQGATITSMQNQRNATSQYCMALQQQSTPINHTAQHQCGTFNSQS
jgi:hypothetical protein